LTELDVSIRRWEWRFVAVVSLCVLLVTSAPYAFASLTTPPEQQFVGFILNTSDHAQYLAWYKAFQTENLTSNHQTSEPNPPLFFNLLWWALGRFGRYTGLSYVVVYQVFRWAAGAFFLAMLYAFTALFMPSVFERRATFLLVALGSGLGWLLVVCKYAFRMADVPFPLDLYVAEGNSFLSVLGYPHFAEAAGLILAVIGLLLLGERRSQLRYAVFAGLVAFFLGWQHTYDLLIVWIVPTVYAGVLFVLTRRWPSYWFKAMVCVGLVSWPPALYSVLLTRLDPLWKQVLAQFANAGVYTPSPPHMLVLMGVPLLLALAQLGLFLRANWKGRHIAIWHEPDLFLGVWFVVGWALTYMPTDFQIHMINSWQVPVGLLAARWIFVVGAPALARRGFLRNSTLALALLVVVVSVPTNIYLWLWRFVDLSRYTYPYYLYRDEFTAMRWLEEAAPPGSIVLSAYDTGRYIPGISGQTAFLSHWAQTVDFYRKRDLVAQFFAEDTSDGFRQEMLREHGVGFVFFGPAEQSLGAYNPEQAKFLTRVFSSPRVRIYQVNLEPPPTQTLLLLWRTTQ